MRERQLRVSRRFYLMLLFRTPMAAINMYDKTKPRATKRKTRFNLHVLSGSFGDKAGRNNPKSIKVHRRCRHDRGRAGAGMGNVIVIINSSDVCYRTFPLLLLCASSCKLSATK